MKQHSFFDTDLVLTRNEGTHLAMIKLKLQQKPGYVLIRNDLSPSYRQEIAALFVVILGIKDF